MLRTRFSEFVAKIRQYDVRAAMMRYTPFVFDWWVQAKAIFNLEQRSVQTLIGLDITPEHVKLLKINRSVNPNMVENFSVVSLPTGVIVNNEIKDFTLLSGVIKDMVRESGMTTKEVAISLPLSLASIKTINIDNRLTQDEIESRAWIEANKHFPDLVGDIYLDFSVTGTSLEDSSQSEVVLVACRKEHIKPYLEILHMAGLVPVIIDINTYALTRSLSLSMVENEQAEVVALLNLNSNLSTLILVQAGNLVFAHDQRYDGQRLISQTSAYYKKTVVMPASDDKWLDDPGYIAILQESFVSHLRQIMHISFSSRLNTSIHKLILSGDCANIAGMVSFIKREIGIDCELANPQRNLALAADINKQTFITHAPGLMLCCGLALSNGKS